MNKLAIQSLLISGLLITSSEAVAASDGFYAELQAGQSKVHYAVSDMQYMSSASIKNKGLGVRPVFGYQMSPNLALELGYTRFRTADFSNIVMNTPNPANVASLSNGSIKVSAWDLAAKAMVPFEYGFGAFAKAGVAYTKAINSGGLSHRALGSDYSSNTKFLPEAGAGVSYDINDNVSTDLSFTRIFKGGNIQAADFAALGLGYHFG